MAVLGARRAPTITPGGNATPDGDGGGGKSVARSTRRTDPDAKTVRAVVSRTLGASDRSAVR